MKRIAAIDVDACVVDTPYEWWKWLELRTKAGLPYEYVRNFYNFSTPYERAWMQTGQAGEPFDYWRSTHVYDDLFPLPGSVEALEALSEKMDVVFVSALKGNHHKSKVAFLKKYFPFLAGVVGTKEKWTVNASMIVDDRNNNLNMFKDRDTIIVRKESFHAQSEELIVKPDCFFNDWKGFQNFVETL